MKKIRHFTLCLVALCATVTFDASAQSHENRMVRVVNRSSSTIQYLYASNVDEDRWGWDVLGLFQVIAPDHYLDIDMDDGTGHCLFDLKAVLADGREAVSRSVNVCTNESWTVYDR